MNIQKVARRVVANLVANAMACFKAFLKAGVMAGVVACTMASTTVQASDLSDKLQSPDYVLLMRHTRAPGNGDPANYTLDDCTTQRNLSNEGRKQALVLVTHHVNIYEFMGENIASGDMVLAKVDSHGKMVAYKLIPRPD